MFHYSLPPRWTKRPECPLHLMTLGSDGQWNISFENFFHTLHSIMPGKEGSFFPLNTREKRVRFRDKVRYIHLHIYFYLENNGVSFNYVCMGINYVKIERNNYKPKKDTSSIIRLFCVWFLLRDTLQKRGWNVIPQSYVFESKINLNTVLFPLSVGSAGKLHHLTLSAYL